jgi:hypothetical protein
LDEPIPPPIRTNFKVGRAVLSAPSFVIAFSTANVY